MFYAGIGSRDTPQSIQAIQSQVATMLANKGYTLRSGGAQGSDKAFENGCDKVNGNKEIYLPWSNFEGSNSKLIVKDIKAFQIAEKFHPYWYNLSSGAQKLQARNSHQVLGEDLNNPSKFIICHTKEGKGGGGTGQALRIASHMQIPVFDCGKYDGIEGLKHSLKLFLMNVTLSK